MNRVFIVRPFGVQSGIDFSAVDTNLIQKALTAAGLEGATTEEIAEAGNIREDMFRLLVTADLVIADISIHNANVFYELGIRHGLRDRSTFLLRANLDKVPFDLSTDRYLAYDPANPGEKVAQLTAGLRATVASLRRDSPVYLMLPKLEAPDPSRLVVIPNDFGEAVDAASKTEQQGDLRLLAFEARGFEWETQGLRLVGTAQFGLKANEGAIETHEWLRQRKPEDLEANRRLATLYQRVNNLVKSNQAIDRVIRSNEPGQSILAEYTALRASNLKTVWKQNWSTSGSTDEQRRAALSLPHLEEAARTYRDGFMIDLNHFYSGLNALSLMCIQIELARALPEAWNSLYGNKEAATRALDEAVGEFRQLALAVEVSLRAARQRLDRGKPLKEDDDIWVRISEADFAFLTSDEPNEVARKYARALASAPAFAADSAARQLKLFETLGARPTFVAAALASVQRFTSPTVPASIPSTPRVLLFTGHMIDKPGREPRFPNTKAAELEARRMIKEYVAAEQALATDGIVGIAGGACGGDILFHEICDELGIRTELYLALPPEKFRATSVAQGGPDWIERFNRLYRRIPPRVLADSEELPVWLQSKRDYSIWQRNNLWMLFNALALRHDGDLTLIALWDKGKADGVGGTEDLVSQVESRGHKILRAPAERLREYAS